MRRRGGLRDEPPWDRLPSREAPRRPASRRRRLTGTPLPRILAVDWGERRIGLALSDPLGVLASPLPTLEIRGEAEAVARVADTIREVGADAVVVGLPLTLKGERGTAAEAAERFAARLREISEVEVSLYDERLTSALAQRRMRETGEKSRGRKGRVDAGAAVALLESWLVRLRSLSDRNREDTKE